MSNPLTSGPNSVTGQGETSTSPNQSYNKAQQAFQQAQRALEPGNAARGAAQARAAESSIGNGDQVIRATYDAHGQPSLPNPKKGKRG